ncbi:SusC/RagA family TonB-linked outer membrane protein [Marinoscillum furvescens]|uniref:TonB-linked SusC/RagA family outer membrane protein n=1 Tax=Marinoscillum furvescens DSM 4134 TaxID=1122208 RepID=A0A3D9L6Q5_MARFU|nr:SusC/RagA family TonB-linked outer membrane protein [Marinoscillum furvescens]REE02028.1 TonB-linked SusC/RagA family outer membrane protein [Marinoscillum furvescens DSM 4134]
MKNYVLNDLIRMSRFVLILMIIQTVSASLLLASETKAQGKSLYEIELSVSVKEATVLEVLGILEEKTPFHFSFNNDLIDTQKSLSLHAKKRPLGKVLEEISVKTSLRFKRVDDNIHIYPKDDSHETVEEGISPDTEVSGTVHDADGEPLPGATVLEKGTTNGTITDLEGKFQLSVSGPEAVIVISFVGFNPQEVALAGRSEVSVTLYADLSSLEEVVVTAFGIEKDAKTLTYSSQNIDSETITKGAQPNLVNSLQGKIAGVSVNQGSGQPGGGLNNVLIRGQNSFGGSNKPLFIIDGARGDADNLDPSQIESINVLKGGAAAALYGVAANNGVIVVTTKRGKGADIGSTKITFNTNYTVDRIAVTPDFQKTYAQGSNGAFSQTSGLNYGPRMDTLGAYTLDHVGGEVQPQFYDAYEAFFRNGHTLNTSVNLEQRGQSSNVNIGFAYTNQDGIVPNTYMKRYNLNVSGDLYLTDKLTVGTLVSLIHREVRSIDQGPASDTNPLALINSKPASYDLGGISQHMLGEPYSPTGWRNFPNNIWMANNRYNDNTQINVLGNAYLRYDFAEWLDFQVRFGFNSAADNGVIVREKYNLHYGVNTLTNNGYISEFNSNQIQYNSFAGLTFKKQLFTGFNARIMVGNEFIHDDGINQFTALNGGMLVAGLHKASNTDGDVIGRATTHDGRRRNVGFLANADFNYNDAFFLNGAIRSDYLSNMPEGNRTFNYGNIGAGVVFTEVLDLNESILNFGKIALNYSEVGQQPSNTFIQQATFNPVVSFNGNWHSVLPSRPTASNSGQRIVASDLRPVNTKGMEYNLALGFLNDRINFNYTYFDTRTEDQIIERQLPASTTASSILENAATVESNGHEISLTVAPIVTNGFRWDLTTNFTSYNNVVTEITSEGVETDDETGVKRLAYNESGFNGMSLVVEEGRRFPALRGRVYARDDQGRIIVDSSTGIPLTSITPQTYAEAPIDFEMSFINRFTYKFVSLSAQIDWRKGGNQFSGPNRLGGRLGTFAFTEDRETEVVIDGVKGSVVDGEIVSTGEANDIAIVKGQAYFDAPWRGGVDGNNEFYTYETSFVRLRELRLDFDLTKVVDVPLFSGISAYIVGRNLLLITDYPNSDPENLRQTEGETFGIEYSTYPVTKSFGGGLKLVF